MSAQEQMRRMLDELMGTRRNGEDTRREKLHFSSARVCKNFLLNCCPHEILAATRCDLGQCSKVHDVALRADYENSSKKDEYNFQLEAVQHLKNFVAERERRTHAAKIRLAETQEVLNAEEAMRIRKIQQIAEKISETLIESEKLGSEGNVEGSLQMLQTVELLKREKEQAEEEYRNATPASIIQQQTLRVCEVCSSYLGVNDNDRRLADHFNGKLHLGFMEIREKLKTLETAIEERQIKNVVDKETEQVSTHSKRSRSPSPRHERHRHKRSRSRSKTRRDSHRHRSTKEESHIRHHRHKYKSHDKDRKRSPSREKISKPIDNSE